jgi:hypothetical protein
MFCRFAFHYMNYRCYFGVLELAVYSLISIRYYSFHLYYQYVIKEAQPFGNRAGDNMTAACKCD